MGWLTTAESLDLSRTHSFCGGVVVIVSEALGKEKNRVWNFFPVANRDNQNILTGLIGQEIPKKLNSI